jgi:serine/threonine protein kinase
LAYSLPSKTLLENADQSYQLVKRLRSGGTCDLYVADVLTGTHAGQRCVLKTLRPELRDEPEHFRMLVSEGAILARLNHPNIVRLYGTTYFDEHPWLVIEYAQGASLAEVLTRCQQQGKTLAPPLAFSIFLQLLEALGYIHGARDSSSRPLELRHRDVNPSNLILTWAGEVKLIDFGISQWRHDGDDTPEGLVKGTPGYLAPEQVQGGAFTDRGDVFSAGLIALVMLSGGASPYARPSTSQSLLATLQHRRPKVQHMLRTVPRCAAKLLESSLAAVPGDRPSASGLAMGLLQCLEASGTGMSSRSELREVLEGLDPDWLDAVQQVSSSEDLASPISADLLLGDALGDFKIPDMPAPVFRAGASLPLPTIRSCGPACPPSQAGTQPRLDKRRLGR